MKYLLDTHVLDWVRHADHRLSIHVQTILAGARKNELAISDVTLTELARLLVKGRIKPSIAMEAWLEAAIKNIVVLPVSPAIAMLAASFDWQHRDPCDRHIVATAIEHRLPLLTIDEKIHAIGKMRGLKVVW